MWEKLPIRIYKRVRQRTGYRVESERAGRGFDIRGVHEFEAGDSPRALSRKHYLRTGDRVVIEKYAEHNAFVLLLLDASASEHIGGVHKKYEASLELLRNFGRACLWKGNSLQVIAFTTDVELESPVIGNADALESVLQELEALKPVHSGTSHIAVLDRATSIAGRQIQPADLVCIISDFFFPEPLEPFFWELETLLEATDVIAFILLDRVDTDMPPMPGALRVRDTESGRTLWASAVSDGDVATKLERFGIDSCELLTSQSEAEWFEALASFFTRRMLRGER